MTTDEWKRKKISDVPQSTTHVATDTHGAHRTRSTWGGNWKTVSVYLTDAKRIDPPTKQGPLTPVEPTAAEMLATMAQDLKSQTQSRRRAHRATMTSASPRTMNCTN